ncbi:MAG: hypothetical protein P8104_11505, partial [Gammaproteobacteria bacterium]
MLDALGKEHEHGVDMELVKYKNKLYVVQQRSQNADKRHSDPSYLSESFMEQHQSELNKITMVSYRNHSVHHIEAKQRLISDSLDDAFYKDYLSMQKDKQNELKVVFVRPPANPNSHAALMFRQQGIAIVQVDDPLYKSLHQSGESILLDEQRSVLGVGEDWSKSTISKGHFNYPAPAVYSLLKENSIDVLERQQERLAALFEMAKQTKREDFSIQNCLEKLKAEIVKTDQADQDIVNQSLASLLHNTFVAWRIIQQNSEISFSTKQEMRLVAREMSADVLRLDEAFKSNASVMHKLLYLNWIESACRQMPHEHVDVLGVASLKSTLGSMKTDLIFRDRFSEIKGA